MNHGGCRPLKQEELDQLKDYFNSAPFHKHLERDKVYIYLSLYIGWRVSEVIQVQVSDVYDSERKRVLDRISIAKNKVKKKVAGKSSPINEELKGILEHYISHYLLPINAVYLFPSPQGGHITYRTALRIAHKHLNGAGLDPSNLATHSFRKTLAEKVYKAVGNDLIALQHALHHKNISSTSSYIKPNKEKVESVLDKLIF
jgi:integrase